MSEEKNKSRSLLLMIIGIILLLIAVFAVSYAAFYYSKVGDKINRVSTGTITMSYSENTNGISLVNVSPMTDEVGMSLNDANQYFDFTVSASMSGSTTVDYVIAASKDNNTTLDDSFVKVYLTSIDNGNETEVLAPTKISSLQSSNNISYVPDNQYVLLDSKFNETDSRNYRLRMWVADDFDLSSVSYRYTLRVNVYGNVSV